MTARVWQPPADNRATAGPDSAAHCLRARILVRKWGVSDAPHPVASGARTGSELDMTQILGKLVQLLLHFFYQHNFVAVFFLVLIEEAGIPIPVPGDSLVMLAGAKKHKTLGYSIGMILVSSAAVFIGSSILYFVIRRKGRPLLDKYGKFVHLNEKRLAMLERWFARHGRLAIIFGRLIPGLRIPTTIMAGLSDVPYADFAPTAAIAAVVWSIFYFWIGLIIQREMRYITAVGDALLDDLTGSIVWLWLIVALCLSGGTIHMGRRIHRKRKERRTELSRIAHGAPTAPLGKPPSTPSHPHRAGDGGTAPRPHGRPDVGRELS